MSLTMMKLGAQANAKATVSCKAVPAAREVEQPSRRNAVMLSGAALTALLGVQRPARALIPDEEDEALLQRAKENRAKTLAEQQAKTRSFMQSEGLANKKLDQDLIPVQKAVYKLTESGKQLEAGDVKQASRTLSDDWVPELNMALKKFSSSSYEVESNLSELQKAAQKEDLLASKSTFVTLVDKLRAWTSEAGVQSYLKGL